VENYQEYGPAYRGLAVKDGVFVPKPKIDFPGDDPYVRTTPIFGEIRDMVFDENYPYLDDSLKFRINRMLAYAMQWFLAAPLNRILYGLKIEGRENLRKNRELFRNGAMTVCNHCYRYDTISVLQAIRFHRVWIPMYALAFRGGDHWKMKSVGGLPIPENRAGIRRFDEAMDELHRRKQWIHIFPETCSWWFYPALRPFKTGAFKLAYKYDIPVIPLMITFRERKGIYKLFRKGDPLATIKIGEPIIPDTTAPRKAEAERLRDQAHKSMLEMAGIVSNPWPSTLE